MTYELKNEFLKLKINELGAELNSIVNMENNREYLWQADPEYWKRYAPVLFPIVGSLKNKQYTYNGKDYSLGQHGFARDMNFKKVSQTSNTLWQVLTADEATYEVYPFKFELKVGYVLEEKCITVIWEIINNDHKTMYYSIGAHPAFNCPIVPDTLQTDYYIGFETTKHEIQYALVNEKGLLKEEAYTLPLQEGYYKITPALFDKDALVVENHQTQKVWLADKHQKPYVTVVFDAPLFGIWSPAKKDAPFICIEPWYGRCDKASFKGELKDREWGNELLPGQSHRLSYQIIIA